MDKLIANIICIKLWLETIPLVAKCLIRSANKKSSAPALKEGQDLGQPLLTEFLKGSENSSPEEHLGMAELVLVLVQLESLYDFTSCYLTVYETLWDGVGCKNGISEICSIRTDVKLKKLNLEIFYPIKSILPFHSLIIPRQWPRSILHAQMFPPLLVQWYWIPSA